MLHPLKNGFFDDLEVDESNEPHSCVLVFHGVPMDTLEEVTNYKNHTIIIYFMIINEEFDNPRNEEHDHRTQTERVNL